MLAPPALFIVLIGVALAPTPVRAQADGTFPGMLSCDALPTKPPVRTPVTVTITANKASYSFPASAGEGPETGGGTLEPNRRLVLTGQGKGNGFSYTARYAGEVGGRGGLLTGSQTWTIAGKSQTRACQLMLGDGRG